MWPVLSALLPVRKFWPSDDDVVPSPKVSKRGVYLPGISGFPVAGLRVCGHGVLPHQLVEGWSFRASGLVGGCSEGK